MFRLSAAVRALPIEQITPIWMKLFAELDDHHIPSLISGETTSTDALTHCCALLETVMENAQITDHSAPILRSHMDRLCTIVIAAVMQFYLTKAGLKYVL